MSDVELFAGPGGFSTGYVLANLGGDLHGYEWDGDACATAVAAGHKREQVDVTTVDVWPRGSIRRLIASPPCQGFSPSGLKLGRGDAGLILQAIETIATGAPADEVLLALAENCADPRSALVLQPLRWALDTEAEVLAWEQVPYVLRIWQACAEVLRKRGWYVWVGVLSAEQYGVAQTRKRAFLIANRRYRVIPPFPTHSRYYARDRHRLDPGVHKWVSMAEALGWGMTERPSHTITAGGTGSGGGVEVWGNYSRRVVMERELEEGRWADKDLIGFPRRDDGREAIEIDGVAYRARDLRRGDEPAFVLTEKARSWVRFAGAGATSEMTAGQIPRDLDEPAHTITGKGTAAWIAGDARPRATRRRLDEPAPAIFAARSGNPRWESGPEDEQRVYERRETIRRVTVAEAAVLQSFSADYPFMGSRTARFRQVGDAVPPLLARHVLLAAEGLS